MLAGNDVETGARASRDPAEVAGKIDRRYGWQEPCARHVHRDADRAIIVRQLRGKLLVRWSRSGPCCGDLGYRAFDRPGARQDLIQVNVAKRQGKLQCERK